MHTLYVLAIFSTMSNIGPSEWSHISKQDCQYMFQIDLCIVLLNYASSLSEKIFPSPDQTGSCKKH